MPMLLCDCNLPGLDLSSHTSISPINPNDRVSACLFLRRNRYNNKVQFFGACGNQLRKKFDWKGTSICLRIFLQEPPSCVHNIGSLIMGRANAVASVHHSSSCLETSIARITKSTNSTNNEGREMQLNRTECMFETTAQRKSRTAHGVKETGSRGTNSKDGMDGKARKNRQKAKALTEEEKEKKRRLRISHANKGKTPWNLGRKHSEETIQRIKERTRIAMQNEELREKLRRCGHDQSGCSEEAKAKIRVSLSKHWAEKKKVFEQKRICLCEWKNIVAEAAREGGIGDGELQWNSYMLLKREIMSEYYMEQRMIKAEEKQKARVYLSELHKRRISDAIRAKWEDEDYKQKVSEGIQKSGKQRRPPRASSPRKVSRPAEKKHLILQDIDEEFVAEVMAGEKKIQRKRTYEPRKISGVRLNGVPHAQLNKSKTSDISQRTDLGEKKIIDRKDILLPAQEEGEPILQPAPTYVDTKAVEKVEKLRKLQINRALMEIKKREAAERARMLMAEAEKAARALEAVAMKDEFAKASLAETRKLLAEAARSIQAIESSSSKASKNSSYENNEGEAVSPEAIPPIPVSLNMDAKNLASNSFAEVSMSNDDSYSVHLFSPVKSLDASSGSTFYKRESNGSLCSVKPTKTTKRWYRGRLVDVEDEMV